MNAWALLALAIATEVAGTTALRASNGLTRVVPVVFVAVGYSLSFVFLALVLKQLALGTTYAIWAGVGTVAIAAIGWVVYRDPLSVTAVLGIVLVVVGVVCIHLGGGAHR